MSRKPLFWIVTLTLALMLGSALLAAAQNELPPASIVNDEGGPVVITGSVAYSDPFFTAGVSEPLIILEDQAGFVDRNTGFIMPQESQVMGQITSDFFTSPFTYSVALPLEPQGSLRDVDQDGESDTGVMVYAVAYWTNTWGDPFLEERDLFGGGWSTAYASTRVNQNRGSGYEVLGGKYIIYAPEDGQGFPSGFGEDRKLFTEDDPIVAVPQGYTVVDMDTDPFTFDRAREQVIDLIEGENVELDDFSGMSYTEAFDAMIELWRNEYAFTELKRIDWDAKSAEFRPLFEQAEANNDVDAYLIALRDFIWSIPDGHHGMPLVGSLADRFQQETAGGLGMAIRALDDGRVLVNFILPEGPADRAGIRLRAEILELNGLPIAQAVRENVPWSSPFSTKHVLQLQQLRYVIRFPVDTKVEVTFLNPGETEPQTVEMVTVAERDSLRFSSFNAGLTGFELPVEFTILDSGVAYVKIYSFFDDSRLTIQLWERMIQTLNDAGVPALIIDMRQNGGGSGFLADQMAAYFFNEPIIVGYSADYDSDTGTFVIDEERPDRFYLPPENLRYGGQIAVLVGPSCSSACEFFSYNMTLQDRAAIVGQYPTGGLGGGQKIFVMPEGIQLQVSVGRPLDTEGNILIEGRGVAPTVRVPVNEDTLFSDGDPILDAAIEYLLQGG